MTMEEIREHTLYDKLQYSWMTIHVYGRVKVHVRVE